MRVENKRNNQRFGFKAQIFTNKVEGVKNGEKKFRQIARLFGLENVRKNIIY